MSVSKIACEREVNPQLRKFADGLKASGDFLSKGFELCEKVNRHLQQVISNGKLEFSIASIRYAGSVGKRTDVKTPDFDIVMKMNNREPPFEDVLQLFQRILNESSSQLEIDRSSIRLTLCSIQFDFVDGLSVDLLPASAKLSDTEALQRMKSSSSPQTRRLYSSTLVATQVEFMKQQDAFAHAAARLAKNWYKTMCLHEHVTGGSYIFELLGVAAAIEEHQGSLWSAFMRVVEKVENLDRLQLSFEGPGPWKIKSTAVEGHQIPYLMEPSNPTNNILLGIKPSVRDAMKAKARSMKSRLERLMKGEEYWKVVEKEPEIDFKKLFQC